MKKIAVTGNIASGKSMVENLINARGFKIIDADFICHSALENNEKIIKEIKENFANCDITDSLGNLNRKKLGEIIFANQDLKSLMEKILHPYVKGEIREFFEENKNEKLVFASIPLLFESNMQNMFDKIILVYADENIRLKRLIKRNNFTEKHALLRIKSQIPQENKILHSDFIINNNADLKNLEDETAKILAQL